MLRSGLSWGFRGGDGDDADVVFPVEGAGDAGDVPAGEGAVEVERVMAAEVLQGFGEAVEARPFAAEVVVFGEDEVEAVVGGGADGVALVRTGEVFDEAGVGHAVQQEQRPGL